MSAPEDDAGEGTFDNQTTALFSSLVQATKATQFLTTADYSFYKSLSPELNGRLKRTSSALLHICNQLIKHVAASGGGTGSLHTAAHFSNVDDVVDNYDPVVEIVDHLLEKADVCLDEVTGRNKQNAPSLGPAGASLVKGIPFTNTRPQNPRRRPDMPASNNILRPQLKFQDKIDNSNNTPFVRRITHKPNAKRPLDFGLPGSGELSSEMAQHVKTLGIMDASSSFYSLPHPYEYEIKSIEYSPTMFHLVPEQLFKPMEETELTYVETLEQFEVMLDKLREATEIAVDTEHHDYRSFLGFVCLIQISTRKEDFIVDALELRSHLHRLNETFTNPEIVKVFHGAEMDVQWLQRDYGVYIVNLFDTYHASHALEMGTHGLAFLLQYYCGVITDKKYQLADWRIRPIPEPMMKYARSDTHYLLYIYDRMHNDLISKSNETANLMRVTLQRSELTSLKVYEKEVYNSETGEGVGGWKNALRKHAKAVNAEQFAVFKALHAWRDHTARREDESTRYVMPHHMLQALADRMPTDAAGVMGCCNPTPPLVRINSVELARLIDRVRVETRQSMETRQKELDKLKDELERREREWEEKRRRGPVHTVFADDDEDVAGGDAAAASVGSSVPARTVLVVDGHTRGDRSTFLPPDLRPNVEVLVAKTSRTVFAGIGDAGIDGEDAVQDVKVLREKRVQEVLSSLKLLPPGLELLATTTLTFLEEDKPKGIGASASAAPVPQAQVDSGDVQVTTTEEPKKRKNEETNAEDSKAGKKRFKRVTPSNPDGEDLVATGAETVGLDYESEEYESDPNIRKDNSSAFSKTRYVKRMTKEEAKFFYSTRRSQHPTTGPDFAGLAAKKSTVASMLEAAGSSDGGARKRKMIPEALNPYSNAAGGDAETKKSKNSKGPMNMKPSNKTVYRGK